VALDPSNVHPVDVAMVNGEVFANLATAGEGPAQHCSFALVSGSCGHHITSHHITSHHITSDDVSHITSQHITAQHNSRAHRASISLSVVKAIRISCLCCQWVTAPPSIPGSHFNYFGARNPVPDLPPASTPGPLPCRPR
jgi:hypothetical protein